MATAWVRRAPISERYRPHRLDDVLGPARSRQILRDWAATWNAGRIPPRRAVVLSGPPGVGKTSTAVALAEEMGWSLVEMNASDARNESAIEQVAGRASITHPLEEGPATGSRRHTLILLDEADSLTGRRSEGARPAPVPPTLAEFLRGRYGRIEALNAAWGLGQPGHPAAFGGWDDLPRSPGRAAWARLPPAQRDLADWKAPSGPSDLSDRGGLGAIAKLVRTTRQPLLLTVNDESVLTRYSPVFRQSVVRLPVDPLRDGDLAAWVGRIAAREGIRTGPGVVEAIAKKARGDLRAALNDLEAIAPLPAGPTQLSVLGVRDLRGDLEALIDETLTAHRFYRSVEVRNRVDAPPDDLLPWVEENLPGFAPDAAHLEAAFDVLGHADLLLQRARRARVWSLWSYASELLTGGVGIAIRDVGGAPRGRVYFPEFLGGMGRSRGARGVRDALATKAGHRLHLSRKKTRLGVLPFLEEIAVRGGRPSASAELRETARRLVRELDLTPEEVAYLIGGPPDSPDADRLLAPDPGEGPEPAPPSMPPAEPTPVPSPARADPIPPPAEAPPTPAPPKKVQRSLEEFDR